MNQNIAAAKDDDEIVFKIKRSAIADALREVRAYCKDAAEKRDPCLISAMAQASAAKSATAEGEAGGKKL